MIFKDEFRQYPYFRLILPFLAGILVQLIFPLPGTLSAGLFSLSVVALLGVFFRGALMQDYHRRWLFGVIVHFVLIMAGLNVLSLHQNRSNYMDIAGRSDIVIGNITAMPEEKPGTYKTVLDIIMIETEKGWTKTRGKVLVYFQKDTTAGRLSIGDQVLLNGSLQEIRYYNNPLEFNYRDYLNRRGIYAQAYLRSDEWMCIAKNKGKFLPLYSGKVRLRLLDIYEEFNISGEELAVAGALTLGFRDRLDDDTRNLYANSGAMHVLAISGLHVGIIYYLLLHLLFFLGNSSAGRWGRCLIIVLFLWFFAFLTGLSPSVMRAATMFSFVTAGQSLRRPINIYNSLAASAFFLLLVNPYLIKEVGFQLSYAAVTGIVFFQPRIFRLYRSRYWIIDKIWGLVTVSFAAQLATFPISIYYFHQFPTCFLFSNIIVIPFATIIIYLGLTLFLFSFIPAIAGIVAWILTHCIVMVNSILKVISGLPYSLVEGISNTLPETFALLGLIILLSLYLIWKKKRYLLLSLAGVALILLSGTCRHYQRVIQKKIILYNIRGATVVGFIDGSKGWLVGDFHLENSRERVFYYVENQWNRLGIKERNFLDLNTGSGLPDIRDHGNNRFEGPLIIRNLIYFHGVRLCIFSGTNLNSGDRFPVNGSDYIICSDNADVDIPTLMRDSGMNQILLDSSNSLWYEEAITRECEKYDLPCYAVSDKGAWIFGI